MQLEPFYTTAESRSSIFSPLLDLRRRCLVPLLSVHSRTALGCCRLDQAVRRAGSQLDIHASTADVDGTCVGRFQVGTGASHGLIGQREVRLDPVDLFRLVLFFTDE